MQEDPIEVISNLEWDHQRCTFQAIPQAINKDVLPEQNGQYFADNIFKCIVLNETFDL